MEGTVCDLCLDGDQKGSTLPAVEQDGDRESKVIFCLERVELCPLQKDKSKS